MNKAAFLCVGLMGISVASADPVASAPQETTPKTQIRPIAIPKALPQKPAEESAPKTVSPSEHETFFQKIKERLHPQPTKGGEIGDLARENAPDYALAIFPLTGWKYPANDQAGWALYYARMGFLLRGGKVHIMSDVVNLPADIFAEVESGKAESERATLLAYGLNYIFSDEGTTGSAVRLQNGLTNIHMTSKGDLLVSRGSMCHYQLTLKNFKHDIYGITGTYMPTDKIPQICGDVPVGMQIGIMTGPKEELLQRLYCDDHPKVLNCAADSTSWTIPEFKRNG